VRQDLAVVVADDVPAAAVVEAVREAGGALLRAVEVFDVYRGAQAGEGRTSLALRLEFRAPDRTLTDEEVAQRREKIVAVLTERLGGELRG
jgi:phenylalanyl-tRNA synthetase beta chain